VPHHLPRKKKETGRRVESPRSSLQTKQTKKEGGRKKILCSGSELSEELIGDGTEADRNPLFGFLRHLPLGGREEGGVGGTHILVLFDLNANPSTEPRKH